MDDRRARELRALSARFALHGSLVDVVPHGSGHINQTYAATYDQAGTPVRYIHQCINGQVFSDPVRLMENVARVLSHAAGRLSDVPDPARRALTLVAARDGRPYVLDEDGAVWRTYLFIEGARTHDIIETPAQAEQAARAFGHFQALLSDLPGERLHDTIPDFHHTRKRFDAFTAAVQADPCNRAHACRDLIAIALAHEPDADRLLAAAASGDVPERVTHNDTKVNNVMMDASTGEALCVVDLDTTMPGLAPIDFGDMVRTATNAAAEDEPDPSRVVSRPEIFEALVRGYLATAGGMLRPQELAWLGFAGQLLAFEQAIRFLADHLQGDTYYRIHRGRTQPRTGTGAVCVDGVDRTPARGVRQDCWAVQVIQNSELAMQGSSGQRHAAQAHGVNSEFRIGNAGQLGAAPRGAGARVNSEFRIGNAGQLGATPRGAGARVNSEFRIGNAGQLGATPRGDSSGTARAAPLVHAT